MQVEFVESLPDVDPIRFPIDPPIHDEGTWLQLRGTLLHSEARETALSIVIQAMGREWRCLPASDFFDLMKARAGDGALDFEQHDMFNALWELAAPTTGVLRIVALGKNEPHHIVLLPERLIEAFGTDYHFILY